MVLSFVMNHIFWLGAERREASRQPRKSLRVHLRWCTQKHFPGGIPPTFLPPKPVVLPHPAQPPSIAGAGVAAWQWCGWLSTCPSSLSLPELRALSPAHLATDQNTILVFSKDFFSPPWYSESFLQAFVSCTWKNSRQPRRQNNVILQKTQFIYGLF